MNAVEPCERRPAGGEACGVTQVEEPQRCGVEGWGCTEGDGRGINTGEHIFRHMQHGVAADDAQLSEWVEAELRLLCCRLWLRTGVLGFDCRQVWWELPLLHSYSISIHICNVVCDECSAYLYYPGVDNMSPFRDRKYNQQFSEIYPFDRFWPPQRSKYLWPFLVSSQSLISQGHLVSLTFDIRSAGKSGHFFGKWLWSIFPVSAWDPLTLTTHSRQTWHLKSDPVIFCSSGTAIIWYRLQHS